MKIQAIPLFFQSGKAPWRWQLPIALLAGLLMGLTPAPVYAWFLAWIALAPLWVLIRKAEGRGQGAGKLAAVCGLMWGIGYHGCALFWITGVHPMTWMGVPWLASLVIAGFCWVFITLWGAVLVALWAWLLHRLCIGKQESQPQRHKDTKTTQSKIQNLKSKILPVWLRVLLGTALWCGLEALWSAGPLWWTSLSYTQSPGNRVILHLGQLSGPVMVTAAIVAFNGFLAETWIKFNIEKEPSKVRKLLGLNVSFLIAVHLLGCWLCTRPLIELPASRLNIGIIQGNVSNAIKLYETGWRQAIEGYTTGYRTLADQGVDVVLTPETALPTVWSGVARQSTSFYQAILEKGVPVWLGAFGKQGGSLTNSLFTVAGDGETLSEYRKVKLVPLGEYIPFETIVGRFINRLSPLDAHLRAGPPHQIFDTPFGRAIVGICYESAFANHFRNQAAAAGEFIITASNDAHYSSTMPAQHHALDVMRAIETDRWAARATNTGYSAIVDPHGKTLWLSGINTYELHAATIHRRATQTLYVRWGDWFTVLLIGVAGLSWSINRKIKDKKL